MAQCIEPLIEELPKKYRDPLLMAELEGMSQKQVAEKLGLSLSGAKSRIQRGRVQLREKITACCDIEVEQGWVADYRIKNESCKDCLLGA
ncbi:MAG: sigma factor-like helix-turn-helix DNA-binding protein [Endozoicomonas sp.]